MIFNEDMVSGGEKVATGEERYWRGLKRDPVRKIAR